MKQNPFKEETLPAGLGKILIAHLIPDKKNPRKDLKKGDPEFEKINKSVEKFGQLDPIIFNTRTRKVIGGHQRLKVLDSKGYTELYTVTLGAYMWAFAEADLKELSDKEESAANIALNKAQGDWEMGQLTINLQELKLDGLLDVTGFDDKEFDAMIRELHKDDEPQDSEPQINRAEELRKEWGTELGQMWQCGDHRVLCGDCTDNTNVLRLMQGEKAECVVTDPPYGMDLDTDFSGMKSKLFKGKTGGNYHDKIIGDAIGFNPTPILPLADEMFLFGADYYSEHLPKGGSWLVWDKRLDDSADKMFGSCFELCWSKKPHKREILRFKWAGIFGTESQDVKTRIHPAQKPIQLIAEILTRYCKDSPVVLDPFLGSGTTMIACENLGRKCRGCEIDPGYVAVILQRYKDTFPDKEIQLIADNSGA